MRYSLLTWAVMYYSFVSLEEGAWSGFGEDVEGADLFKSHCLLYCNLVKLNCTLCFRPQILECKPSGYGISIVIYSSMLH